MTKQLNLYEAKTQLSRLVEAAARGEEFIIAKNGVPLALLTRAPAKPRKREFGFLKGKVHSPTDEELAEMDREILEMFEESAKQPIDPTGR